jgi:hypothetical protein
VQTGRSQASVPNLLVEVTVFYLIASKTLSSLRQASRAERLATVQMHACDSLTIGGAA